MAKKSNFKENKEEILYNIINSALAGSLVFLGSISTGEITMRSIYFAAIASGIVIITKFKNYWEKEKTEYSRKLFDFI